MVGHGGSSAGSYLADPTSPIPSHCASIVATSTLRLNNVSIMYAPTLFLLSVISVKAVFLYCCLDFQNCPASSNGPDNLGNLGSVKKHNLCKLRTLLSSLGLQTKLFNIVS